MSVLHCFWFLFWTVLNAKDSEEKEAGQCGVCFHSISVYFLSAVFIE